MLTESVTPELTFEFLASIVNLAEICYSRLMFKFLASLVKLTEICYSRLRFELLASIVKLTQICYSRLTFEFLAYIPRLAEICYSRLTFELLAFIMRLAEIWCSRLTFELLASIVSLTEICYSTLTFEFLASLVGLAEICYCWIHYNQQVGIAVVFADPEFYRRWTHPTERPSFTHNNACQQCSPHLTPWRSESVQMKTFRMANILIDDFVLQLQRLHRSRDIIISTGQILLQRMLQICYWTFKQLGGILQRQYCLNKRQFYGSHAQRRCTGRVILYIAIWRIEIYLVKQANEMVLKCGFQLPLKFEMCTTDFIVKGKRFSAKCLEAKGNF